MDSLVLTQTISFFVGSLAAIAFVIASTVRY